MWCPIIQSSFILVSENNTNIKIRGFYLCTSQNVIHFTQFLNCIYRNLSVKLNDHRRAEKSHADNWWGNKTPANRGRFFSSFSFFNQHNYSQDSCGRLTRHPLKLSLEPKIINSDWIPNFTDSGERWALQQFSPS